MKAGPELSRLAEKHAGQVAVVGVNNESMFAPQELDVEKVKAFLEKHTEAFRYMIYIDKQNLALESKFA